MRSTHSGAAVGAPALTAVLTVALALSAVPANAQDNATAAQDTPSAAPSSGNDTLVLDPVAMSALKGMGAYLASLQKFELHTKATVETTLQDTDLSVHLGYEGTYYVQRPTGFFVQMKSDRTIREYIYDGKTFTVNVPRQKFFSTVAAPPTIRKTIDKVYLDYGISLPLADLFYWADNPTTDGIRKAVRIGYANVNGQDCDQFAYRGDDLDWELWIARGKAPLPLRIVVTHRDTNPRGSYSADLTWNTSPSFDASRFRFTPPDGAKSISLAAATGEQ
ncbi:hypothetical protein EDF56_102540 [Novosphingobium sp. PhB165]|uniref:DUF2092 domain-containing protein n=1 Tax=Novosphingobium sp. PhB165 TaxID=2485105 RepID=UPI001047ACA3|nr:DUF2092 domain-containing protein [Novosphingobium sp. PhB165]TCM20877.1 hypothetical protein EDF56_102540 [Novosphingobium sp. PhB165]